MPCSNQNPLQHRKYVPGKGFVTQGNVSGTATPCSISKIAFQGMSSNRAITTSQHTHEADASPINGRQRRENQVGGPDAGSEADADEAEECTKPNLHWQLLPRHGCTVKEMVCIDQVNLLHLSYTIRFLMITPLVTLANCDTIDLQRKKILLHCFQEWYDSIRNLTHEGATVKKLRCNMHEPSVYLVHWVRPETQAIREHIAYCCRDASLSLEMSRSCQVHMSLLHHALVSCQVPLLAVSSAQQICPHASTMECMM